MLYVRTCQRYFVTFQHQSSQHWSLLYLYKKALQKQLQFRSLGAIDGGGGLVVHQKLLLEEVLGINKLILSVCLE